MENFSYMLGPEEEVEVERGDRETLEIREPPENQEPPAEDQAFVDLTLQGAVALEHATQAVPPPLIRRGTDRPVPPPLIRRGTDLSTPVARATREREVYAAYKEIKRSREYHNESLQWNFEGRYFQTPVMA